MQRSPLGPGSTIGILGGGQLALMTALEARRMGYRVATLDPDPKCSAAQLCDYVVTAGLDDVDAARDFADKTDVITVDTEHVPAEVLAELEALRPAHPTSGVLRIVQDRLAQRRQLDRAGLAQPRHAAISDEASLGAVADLLGFPCVLKTRRSGYDGKGQARAYDLDELSRAWQALGRAPAIAEEFVEFEREISVVLSRGQDGELRVFPVAENEHRNHILYLTRAPARIPERLAAQAIEIAAEIAVAFEHVGTMAVELFVTREQTLLVNEVAPRTHNSGHFTLGACATSQFEQQVRAICGLPLGDPSLLRPAAMVNLMGELWQQGEPDWAPLLSHPAAHLHLYGKARAYAGRKMGHVLFFAEPHGGDPALAAAEQLQRCLSAAMPADRAPAALPVEESR